MEASRVTLAGNVHPLAQARFDVGPAAGSAKADRLMLILKRSPQQNDALIDYLREVQDPGSARFRKFLTPEEFGARFGISDADAAQVEEWLQDHGFSVAGMNKGRTAIEFSGTVEQVELAFHTAIHRFRIAGAEHLANVADPQIPAALAPVVGGVASLNDFKPAPNVVTGPSGKWDATLNRFTPDLTLSSNGTKYLFLGPGDAATIYNAPNSLNTRLAAGQATFDGTGVTIGVAGTTLLDSSGDTFYRELFGLDSFNFQGAITVYDGNSSNFDQSANQVEASGDVEIAGALAPGASVLYYAAGDTAFQSGLFLAIYRALDDNKISILNVSYGACEAALGTAGNLQVLNAWEQAAAQGVTVTVSSGDSGSAGCDNPNLVIAATQGFGVNGLASTPYNIAVGGTDFDALSKSFSTYASSTNSANFTSALNYIPEEPWNDSTKGNGALASNSPLLDGSGHTNIWSGGGGVSSAASGSAGYPKPDWQIGFSPSNTDAVRDLPDVSLFAGTGHNNAIWALCIQSDCDAGANSSIHGVGGTSTSAPALAGILALVTQKLGAGTRLGQANWVLYKLAQTTPSIFHSIASGNNSVYCKTGTPNCGSNNFLTGYNAQAKYNMATGLGSVDATLLVNHWNDDARGATTTTLKLDKTTFTHGSAVAVTAGVNPTSASGAVAITDDYASQQFATGSTTARMFALSGGSASGSYSEFPGGTYNLFASYGGDGGHSGSISQPVKVTVTPEDSVLKLSVDSVNSSYQLVDLAGRTVPLGAFITMNAQPVGVSQSGSNHPVTNATGAVMFYTDGSGDQAQLDSTGNSEFNTINLQAGSHSITATYPGDLSYNGSTAGPINFTIAPVNTTISVLASDTSTIQNAVQITAQISALLPANAGFYGSGDRVTFTDITRNVVLGKGSYTGACQAVSTFCFAVYFQVDSTQLAPGDNLIMATFAGDSNFNASGDSAPVKVTCVASCWNTAGQRLELSFSNESPLGTVSAGQNLTALVDVWQSGGFTGDVNLTCSVAGKNAGDQHIPTCSFNPAKGTITSTQGAESTLTINTTAPTKSATVRPNGRRTPWGPATVALGSLLLCLMPARRFRRRYLMLLAALLMSVGGLSACGGGGSSGGGSTGGGGGGGGSTVPGTTADTYTVTFRAVDVATGTVTAQDYFSVNVN
ncbi:MAG TPA: protease pro-enzyme activation domain-containing protein [Terracidiphilus sp.]